MSTRVAANPIPYWLQGTKTVRTREGLEAAFTDLQKIGFSSVKADIPEDMAPADYIRWLGEYRLEPAVGLYNSTFDRSIPLEEDVEAAKRFASDQAELGLTVTMLCPIFVPERLQTPGVGVAFDEGRFQNVLEDMAAVAQAIKSEGVHPVLHGHTGGWVETESELRRALDELGSEVVGFGPDTGHLTWCGMDPARMIADYSDRVGAIHVKDVYPDHLGLAAEDKLTYAETAATKRLWAEPGKGVVDFDGVLAAMPHGFDGDFMIEVDVPSAATKFDSLQESYDWAKKALEFARL
ncbi:sugar phosphate isomerase/epimerase family protein [Rothia uropygialis]|uniref:sugar phosphate isomerase/epimerase family protein n=1 Tax=Kocuria sp. 36 TaxID=1415402 RepID=UPI001931161A|nr:sugar phosphate isomerase/epimerase [Kocuria sp. 36]